MRGLYVIADTGVIPENRLNDSVAAAIAGGATIVQYRDKAGSAGSRMSQANALAGLCALHGVTFIVNDDVRLARLAHADGVHLGRDDPELKKTRAILGDAAVIGVSCYNDLDRALRAQRDGASYVAFGSFYPSTVKPDAVRASVELLREAKKVLKIPVVAIGGITPDNAPGLIEAGADALAVITGVFGEPDVEAAARRYEKLFY